jgi:hypothetical protein
MEDKYIVIRPPESSFACALDIYFIVKRSKIKKYVEEYFNENHSFKDGTNGINIVFNRIIKNVRSYNNINEAIKRCRTLNNK